MPKWIHHQLVMKQIILKRFMIHKIHYRHSDSKNSLVGSTRI